MNLLLFEPAGKCFFRILSESLTRLNICPVRPASDLIDSLGDVYASAGAEWIYGLILKIVFADEIRYDLRACLCCQMVMGKPRVWEHCPESDVRAVPFRL